MSWFLESLTMLYDLIAFFFRRNLVYAVAICAHATKYMDANQLREAGDYFKSLADSRAAGRRRPAWPAPAVARCRRHCDRSVSLPV